MKTPRIYIGALAVFCIAALVIGTSGAAAATPQVTTNNLKEGTGHFGPEKILDNLTAQGYDVSAIRTAMTTENYETAHTLMQEFRTAYPDAFPTPPEGARKGPMNGEAKEERMSLLLDNLTAQGYDVSAIRTAVTTGDYKTVHTLTQEFRTAHPNVVPTPPEGAGKGPMNGEVKGDRMIVMLDNLTAHGYDVSAIRTAVTNGDYETAHTLMQEFRTAHPDAFPARGEGAGKGPIIGKVKGDRILLMLDNLTAQGFDVSVIRTAVTTGDYETAHTLMQDFRTAHPDAFPTPREFAGCVHRCGQR